EKVHARQTKPPSSERSACEQQCKQCGEWKHYSRFHSWRRKDRGSNSSVAPVRFSLICRDCEQKARNERKRMLIDRRRSEARLSVQNPDIQSAGRRETAMCLQSLGAIKQFHARRVPEIARLAVIGIEQR